MHPSQSLKDIIYSEFLKSSLVPIFVIEVTLLLLYFGINHIIADRNQEALLEEVQSSLMEISGRQARIIDQKLNEISRLSILMQEDHQHFFAHLTPDCPSPLTQNDLTIHANGALYKPVDNGGASLYFSSHGHHNDLGGYRARCSEVMDVLLKSIVDNNPLIAQAYFNSYDGMNRLYPFIDQVAAHYGSTLKMPDYNFFYLADEQHNPSRNTVWTGAYLDPAGQGWLISNIVPVYRADALEGVSGLDVTIDELVNSVLDQKLPWKSSAFMVDEDGMILAMAPEIEELLGLMELKKHTYRNNITHTVEKPEAFNIFNGSDAGIRQQLVKILEADSGAYTLSTAENRYLAVRHAISETGWQVITLVDEVALLAPIERMKERINHIGYIAILVMMLFYGLFFLWLQRKASRLGERLAKPVQRLAEASGELGNTLKSVVIPPSGIQEVDAVFERFNHMAGELQQKTKQLVDAESKQRAQQAESSLLERLATTDSLTGLNNRRKMEEAILSEITRAGRSHKTFSVIILDVDGFKEINDTFGHQIGDRVLVDIGQILKYSLRQADVIGRWGGEEFILMCPVTELDGATNVAENLRARISKAHFDRVGNLSASFGVTSYTQGDSIRHLVERADQAMYQAKREGRNRVKVYHSSMSL